MVLGIASLVFTIALGAQAAEADMTHFNSPGERIPVSVVSENGGGRIDIPQRRVWLYILPCLVITLICAVPLAAGLADLFTLRLSFFGILGTLLAAALTAGSGGGLLWLTVGRDVIRVKLGSVEMAREIFGRRIGKPDRYTAPILEVRVEDSISAYESSDMGAKFVRVRFVDADELAIRSFLDETEARQIADAIRAHDRGPELKEVPKDLFQETYFKHGGAQNYWDYLSMGARNRYFIAQPATPEHRRIMVRTDGDAVRLCFYVEERQ